MHQLITVLIEMKNMLPVNLHSFFQCELFPWFIFLAECKILNFVDIGRHHCLDDRLPAISHVDFFFI